MLVDNNHRLSIMAVLVSLFCSLLTGINGAIDIERIAGQ